MCYSIMAGPSCFRVLIPRSCLQSFVAAAWFSLVYAFAILFVMFVIGFANPGACSLGGCIFTLTSSFVWDLELPLYHT